MENETLKGRIRRERAWRMNAGRKNDPYKQAGMTNLHRDTGGRVVGGYTAEGTAFGTKRQSSASGSSFPGLARYDAMQAGPRRLNPYTDKTKAATGNILNARQNLFKQMQAAGPGGITDAMRTQARSLGVTDSGFNMAVDRIGQTQTAASSAMPRPTIPPPPQPAI